MHDEWKARLEVYNLFSCALGSAYFDVSYPRSQSCNGVQVGGVRSSYGVLGSWTTAFHHPDDPVGALKAPMASFVPH
jgi:hypothetical protein